VFLYWHVEQDLCQFLLISVAVASEVEHKENVLLAIVRGDECVLHDSFECGLKLVMWICALTQVNVSRSLDAIVLCK
jgi:hypothetical protein